MSETSRCPLDGGLRRIVERDRLGILWRCGWCGQHSREEFEPDPRNDIQRSFDR